MRVRYVLLVAAMAFALGMSALADLAGSALIIGAFAAGLDPVRARTSSIPSSAR